MTAFAAAAAALVADRNLGEDATYTSVGGAAVPLRVVVGRPDRTLDVGMAGLHVPSLVAGVLASDLPPGAAAGDQVTIGGAGYRVRRITRDAAGATASLDLDPL